VANLVFANAKLGVDQATTSLRLAAIEPRLGTVDWAAGEDLALAPAKLLSDPEGDGVFEAVAPAAAKVKSYEAWGKSYKTWLGQSAQVELLQSEKTGAVSLPGESERDFRIRLQTLGREQRDQALAKLRQKYAAKLMAFDDKIRRAQQAVDREAEQATQAKLQTGLSIGATVLGALFGRKAVSTATLGRATTAARGVGRSMKEQQDIARAKETLDATQQQKADLEAQIQSELDAVSSSLDPAAETLAKVAVKPKRTDITVQTVGLAWVPFVKDRSGGLTRA
jgi:hypothetical protein